MLKGNIGIDCLICGETVVLTENEELSLEYGVRLNPKICNKCKATILYVRKQLEEAEVE